jgi:DNA-binding winged helix-turn-helix (wHTH) protein/tetratricopeptide (TPR) repeat protein
VRYRFDGFSLDARERRVEFEGRDIHIRPRSLDTLIYLVEHRGRLVTKDELLDTLWSDAEVTENSLMQCVGDLREALGDDSKNPHFIRTIPRTGYRFIAEVEVISGREDSEYEVEELTSVSTLVVEDDDGCLADGAARSRPSSISGQRAPTGRGRVRRAVWVVVTLSVVAGAFALLSRLSDRASGLEFHERDWILITDFDNRTGDSVFDLALRTELERGLSVSRYANFVPPGRVVDTLELMQLPADTRVTEQLGREICLRDGGIRAMVCGSMQKIAGTYVIALKLIDPATGTTVEVFEDRAAGRDDVLNAMHRLSEQLRRELGEPLATIAPPDQTLERVTTDSLEALTLYSTGLHAIQQFHWGRAETFFDQAVAEDPEFALGHYFRGLSRMMLSKDSAEDLARAVELSGEVTLRERLMIRATVAATKGENAEAVDLWESLIEQYPDDYWAHEYLSWLYFQIGNYQGWVDHQAACRRLRPNFLMPRFHRGWVYLLFEGDVEKAQAELAPLLESNPDFPSLTVQFMRVYAHWMRGQMELAAAALSQFREDRIAVLPAFAQILARRVIAQFHLFNGREDEALAMLETTRGMTFSIDQADLAERNRFLRALIYQRMGRDTEAERLLREEAAANLGINRVEALGWLGIHLARNGRVQDARDLLDELERETRHPPVDFWHPRLPLQLERAQQAFGRQIRGEILLAEGRTDAALRSFDQVLALVQPRNALFDTILTPRVWLAAAQSMARAYERQEDWDAAVQVYESILERKVLCLRTSGAAAIWFDALRSIAPALEQAGRTEQAAGYREELLRLRPAGSSRAPAVPAGQTAL